MISQSDMQRVNTNAIPPNTPIPPYQPTNAFIPGKYADLNTALGLFPPNAVNVVQPMYYSSHDIAKLDPDFAKAENVGRIVQGVESLEESDPGILGRLTKTIAVLGVLGGMSILGALVM